MRGTYEEQKAGHEKGNELAPYRRDDGGNAVRDGHHRFGVDGSRKEGRAADSDGIGRGEGREGDPDGEGNPG